MKDIQRIEPDRACQYIASLLKVPTETFRRYYSMFSTVKPTGENSNWSMPEAEARLLYAITRTTKPSIVLEYGTHLGYSTTYFREALNHNEHGVVVTLDRKQHHNGLPRLTSSYRVIPLTTDGVEFSKTLCFPVDLIFEDSSHQEDNTRQFLTNCLPWLSPGGIVLVHDICFPGYGEGVTRGMAGALGDNIERLIISNSPCGLGLWIKPLLSD